MPKRVERGVELLAAAPDEARRRTVDDDGVAGGDEPRRLVGDGAVDEHPPGGDRRPGRRCGWRRVPVGRARRRGADGRPLRPVASWRPCARRSCRPPSWPAPSWPAPSWPAPSSPAPSWPAPSSPAPSWPAPSWPAPSSPAPSWPAPSSPAPSWPAPSWPAPAPPAGLQPRHERLELVLEVVDAVGQPAELLGDLVLHRLGELRRRLLPALDQRLHRRLGLGAADLARLDELLHHRLGLLARHLGELDARLEQLLQGVLGHRAMLTGRRAGVECIDDARRGPAASIGHRHADGVARRRDAGAHEGERAAERRRRTAPSVLAPVADHEQRAPARTSPTIVAHRGGHRRRTACRRRPAGAPDAVRDRGEDRPAAGDRAVRRRVRGVVVGGDEPGAADARRSPRCASARSRSRGGSRPHDVGVDAGRVVAGDGDRAARARPPR